MILFGLSLQGHRNRTLLCMNSNTVNRRFVESILIVRNEVQDGCSVDKARQYSRNKNKIVKSSVGHGNHLPLTSATPCMSAYPVGILEHWLLCVS